MTPVRRLVPQRRRRPVPVEPVNRRADDIAPWDVHEGPGVGDGKLGTPMAWGDPHPFDDGYGRTGQLHPVEIERSGEERLLVNEHQVAAGKVPAMVPAPMQDLARAVGKRLDDEARVVVLAADAMGGVEDSTIPEHLRP